MLRFDLPEKSYQNITLFNITGQKVLDRELKEGQSSIDMQHLEKGMYIVSFSGAAGRYTTKVVK